MYVNDTRSALGGGRIVILILSESELLLSPATFFVVDSNQRHPSKTPQPCCSPHCAHPIWESISLSRLLVIHQRQAVVVSQT